MMEDKFNNYPEISWRACAAAQAYAHLDRIQIMPDLENFRLERFTDLRKQPKVNEGYRFKLILVGSSKTNIFIDGPDSLINMLVAKLPSCIGKTWSHIKSISLERSFINCTNFLKEKQCNPWIIGKFEFKELSSTRDISYFNNNDLKY